MGEPSEVKSFLKTAAEIFLWLFTVIFLWLFIVMVLVSLIMSFAGCDGVTIGEQPAACPSGQCDQPCPDGQCPEQDTSDWPKILQPCPPEANPNFKQPPCDVPQQWRVSNYSGGSCNHAAMQQCLKWQGQNELAEWWRKTYSGGESAEGLAQKAEAKGIRFAATHNGDVDFLEWCSRTRRGAAIHYFPNHAIFFAGYTGDGRAALIDNNRVREFIYVPKDKFVRDWLGYGGEAITVVYSPPPPKPWVPVGARVIIGPYGRPYTFYRPRPYVPFTVNPRPYVLVPVPRPMPRPVPRPFHIDIRW